MNTFRAEKNVLEYLENTVIKYKDKTAILDEDFGLTFYELYQNGQAIGSYLARKQIVRKPVVIYMKKTPKAINAFLGALYAGCYYVPLDTEIPKFRVDLILENLQPEVIICDDSTIDEIDDQYKDCLVKFEDLIDTPVDDKLLQSIRTEHIDTDPMYIVFTSGSTGIPKGVIANHRSVIDYMEQFTDVLGIDDASIFGLQSPLYFDACLKEIYSTLKCGASLVMVPKQLFMFPIKLVEFLNTYEINTVCWVVSALTMISGFDVFKSILPKELKTIAFGSEVFQIKQFNYWQKHLPDAKFFNLYGPTEATGMSCYYEVNKSFELDEVIPIGKPFNNTRVYVIDEEKEVKASDVVGELYIGGTPVTMGYFNDEQRSSECFVQNPLNNLYRDIVYKTGDLVKYDEEGNLIFVSRVDNQIKHMGQRIELGEIEVQVSKMENVTLNCCTFDHKKKKIKLFYTGSLSKKEITEQLKATLPRYMVPNKIVQLDEMPLTANGKLDRKKLSEY